MTFSFPNQISAYRILKAHSICHFTFNSLALNPEKTKHYIIKLAWQNILIGRWDRNYKGHLHTWPSTGHY